LGALITGPFSLVCLFGVAGGANSSGDLVFFELVVALFALSALALVGVATRARWSRVAAVVAGIAVSLTCIGLLLGIPILVAAWRAPNLAKQSA
jgi:hypothetical protein